MSPSVLQILTFGSLVIAGLLSIFWLMTVDGAARFEPAVTGLAVLAAVTGVFAERWVAARQKREEAIEAVTLEVTHNTAIVERGFAALAEATGRRRVYPRFVSSAAQTALVSDALRGDMSGIRLLQEWTDMAGDRNHRLDIAELMMFGIGSGEDIQLIHASIYGKDGLLDEVRAKLRALTFHFNPLRRSDRDYQ
jgi:hypothetical protein